MAAIKDVCLRNSVSTRSFQNNNNKKKPTESMDSLPSFPERSHPFKTLLIHL